MLAPADGEGVSGRSVPLWLCIVFRLPRTFFAFRPFEHVFFSPPIPLPLDPCLPPFFFGSSRHCSESMGIDCWMFKDSSLLESTV